MMESPHGQDLVATSAKVNNPDHSQMRQKEKWCSAQFFLEPSAKPAISLIVQCSNRAG
jgi:hypothetical protein